MAIITEDECLPDVVELWIAAEQAGFYGFVYLERERILMAYLPNSTNIEDDRVPVSWDMYEMTED
jgi:hypothetical protein